MLTDAIPEDALSAEFLDLRARALASARRCGELRLAGALGAEIAAAEKECRDAENAALARLLVDRDRYFGILQQKNADTRERERLAEREEATLRRVLLALRDRGPLTGSQLEALRIEGASHNLLRPILTLGTQRGLVRRVQDGRRVLWSAANIYSPE